MAKKKKATVTRPKSDGSTDQIIPITGMYEDYFLDYASYVILERAIPGIIDGVKPVQRRILHSMKVMDDGRFHKVANIIGQTMQYHPHGDAAIGAALVKMGQKDLLIDTQGNWGDVRTGDSAAASRYIEARLTKFALDIAFNPQTTDWQVSYDGRKKEPIALPMKFPLLLAQGAEGIAVGLSTKILPHNFIELIKASIRHLQGKKTKLYPDFLTGGLIDVSEYNDGKRGGKIKVRARIEQVDKNTLKVVELPYNVTSGQLIDSIIKANDKGSIKVKKVVDNTAKDVEILIELPSGVSPQVTIDALYAFTHCEISISPNACVIVDNKPHFLGVNDILSLATDQTKALLKMELEIKQGELMEKWHMASLEKIFIENKIYRDIEECETWEAVLEAIDAGLKKYVVTPSQKAKRGDKRIKLMRDITEEDLIKLTEIKIKRISKYNKFKADERIAQIEEDLKEVKYNLKNLTDFAIDYFNRLLEKYGKGRERRTEITSLETIKAVKVVANNAKLYVNRKEGFIGTGLKKEELVSECSTMDNIIAFRKDGKCMVVKVSDNVFVGKDILHTAVWKKGDDRTTYNMLYVDGKTGRTMAKRFNVTAVTRDKEYDLTKGNKGSKTLYFTANPNGESETVSIQLTSGCGAHKKVFDFDFADIAIKGRASQGNIVTKYPVRKVTQVDVGKSSLGAQKVWMDDVSGRINKEERGIYLGEFDSDDQILVLNKNGTYVVKAVVIDTKIDVDNVMEVAKFTGEEIVNAVYYDGDKGYTMVKRFFVETAKLGAEFKFITEANGSKLYFAGLGDDVQVDYTYKKGGKKEDKVLDFPEFISVKGWKSIGNRLGDFKLLSAKKKIKNEGEWVEALAELDEMPAKSTSRPQKSTRGRKTSTTRKPKATAKSISKTTTRKPKTTAKSTSKTTTRKPKTTAKSTSKTTVRKPKAPSKPTAKHKTASKATTKTAAPKRRSTTKKTSTATSSTKPKATKPVGRKKASSTTSASKAKTIARGRKSANTVNTKTTTAKKVATKQSSVSKASAVSAKKVSTRKSKSKTTASKKTSVKKPSAKKKTAKTIPKKGILGAVKSAAKKISSAVKKKKSNTTKAKSTVTRKKTASKATKQSVKPRKSTRKKKLTAGDTIEFDL